ncbi:MAG: glycoside hydrolase family 92 protein [Myxococcales bacterium]|nr:glycoside hydrolase family 92 protein [Myxococcales bacterium]
MRRLGMLCFLALAAGCDDGPGAANGQAADARMDQGPQDAAPGDAARDLGLPDAAPDAAPLPELPTVEQALDTVDPFIGTGGQAFGYAAETPAAQVPLGMVRLGPDTTAGGVHPPFHHFSGFHFDDPDVRGFSHTHFVGTGAPDYGQLRVLPYGALDGDPWDRFVAMAPGSQQASPGRYAVRLVEPAVDVALTASARAGLHRYRFEQAGQLLVDAASTVADDHEALDAQIEVTPDGLEGQVTWRGSLTSRTRPQTLFFSIAVEGAAPVTQVWDAEGVRDGQAAQGTEAGALVPVAAGATVVLRVGVSYVDRVGARSNRAEVAGDFDAVAAAARAEWARVFGRARFAGGTAAQRRMVQTAQYHAYAMPTRFDDGDGRYRGLDGSIHTADGWRHYTDLSLWDTFRTLHPWYELTDPDTERDCLNSLLAMARDGGVMPRWPAAASYGSSMIGSSADLLFAGGLAKGIAGVDYDAAFDALWIHAGGDPPPDALFGARGGMADYLALGYLPHDRHGGSVSRTVEFVYSDAMLAPMAAALGRPEAAELAARAGWYANLYDPAQGLLVPRNADGSFERVTPDRNYYSGGPYVEGSALHWTFSVLHDPLGYAALRGGPDVLAADLEALFAESRLGQGIRDTRSPDGHYWHGNEPMLHAVWLFQDVGRPDRLGHWLRAIQRVIYLDTPDGLPGNDDGGTMSAWYLFAAAGLYPVAGSDRYRLGPPLFPVVELLTAGGPLRIEAPGASGEAQQVVGVWLDGEPVEGFEITHAELLAGQTLRFALAPVE